MNKPKIMTGWKRILSLQQRAQEMYLTGVLIHKPENIYYFTSVYPHEPSFVLVPTDGEPEMVAARSVLEEANRDSLIPVTAGDMDIAGSAYQRMVDKKMLRPPPNTFLKGMVRKVSESPIGIEADYLSLFLFQFFQIRNHMNITHEINALREIKDSFEVQRIEEACRIADQAMEHLRQKIRVGVSEKELSGIFDARAKALGAEESKCRIKSGPGTALAFSRWMDQELENGPLLIDYGARIRGYWSDITRMFYLGTQPDSSFLEYYNLVLQARQAALGKMHPGQSIYGPEEAIKELFRRKDLEQHMIYAAGHGIGLEVHEEPLLGSAPEATREEEEDKEASLLAKSGLGSSFMSLTREMEQHIEPVFAKGHVVALEPGLYFQELGVRVEDVVHISDKPRVLSSLSTDPKDMVIPA